MLDLSKHSIQQALHKRAKDLQQYRLIMETENFDERHPTQSLNNIQANKSIPWQYPRINNATNSQ